MNNGEENKIKLCRLKNSKLPNVYLCRQEWSRMVTSDIEEIKYSRHFATFSYLPPKFQTFSTQFHGAKENKIHKTCKMKALVIVC